MQPLLRALILFFAFALFAQAQAANVALFLSGDTGPYAEFAASFEEYNRKSSWKISRIGKIDQHLSSDTRPDLIIAVGSAAFRAALAQNNPPPILATLIPRHAYETILNESPQRRSPGSSSAIFLDQPETRLAAFIRQLLPAHGRIGLLSSEETRRQLDPLRKALGRMHLEHVETTGDQALLGALNELLPRVNLLLALPDSTIYKRDNIKPILVTAFRHQRPVIAFSKAFVTAGALAAIYSTPAQIAQQTSDLLNSLPTNLRTLPPPLAPEQFAISINSSVAESLNLDLPDETVLYRALKAEGGPK